MRYPLLFTLPLMAMLLLAAWVTVSMAQNGPMPPFGNPLGLEASKDAAVNGAKGDPTGDPTRANGVSGAASDKPASAESEDALPTGIVGILMEGGVVGLLIILLSIAAVALVVEYAMTIRPGVLMPRGLAAQVAEHLKAGNVRRAVEQCKLQPSVLSHIIQAGLVELDGKWTSLEKSMEDATAEQSARMYRKIEYLSVIGNIAPMLGLLGTVIGMIFAFRTVAETDGAASVKDLAGGIYLALVTTVEGLVVAIPSLAAFAVFRNRVDHLVAESAYAAMSVFAPFKRRTASPEPPPRDETYQAP